MWFACAMLLVLAPVVFGQRFIQEKEALSRLKPGQVAGLSCSEEVPGLKFELTINANGEVSKVRALKPRSIPVRYSLVAYRFLRNRAERLVRGWHFVPMLVANRPSPLKTIVTVPCTPQ